MNALLEKITKIFRKNPLLCVSIAVILVVGLCSYLRNSGASELATTLEETQARGERLQANVRHTAQLDEQLSVLTQAEAAIEERVMKVGEIALNLRYFYELEASTGTRYRELRQGMVPPTPRGQPEPMFVPIPFNVAVEGRYFQLINYLNALEHGPHFVRVRRAAINGSGQLAGVGDSALMLDLELEILGRK